MDLGRSPIGILFPQAANQPSNLFGNLGPTATRPGAPTPVKAKAGAMPAYEGRGLHDDQNVGPAGPAATESGPENSVQPVQLGPRTFTLEHGELLSQCQNLESGIAPTAQENAERGDEDEDRFEHDSPLLARANPARQPGAVRSQTADFA